MNTFARLTTVTAIAAWAALAITGPVDITLATALAQPVGVAEDDPGWDCRRMGNMICGPTNDQGVTAGQYAGGGLIPWPHNEIPAWCLDVCRGA